MKQTPDNAHMRAALSSWSATVPSEPAGSYAWITAWLANPST